MNSNPPPDYFNQPIPYEPGWIIQAGPWYQFFAASEWTRADDDDHFFVLTKLNDTHPKLNDTHRLMFSLTQLRVWEVTLSDDGSTLTARPISRR